MWVTEFPLLEYSEEENRYVAMHHPFTMPMEEDWHLIDTDPGAVRAKAYDIVLNGTELGGGSVRIHQSDIQSKMFEVLGFTPERAKRNSSASCWRPSNTAFRLMRDWPTAWTGWPC